MTFPTRLEPTSNAADWESEAIEVFDAETGAEISDLSGFVFDLELRSETGVTLLTDTSAGGAISIADHVLNWVIPAARMRAAQPGTYAVYLRATETATGAVDQLLATQIQIYEGGFK